MERVARKIRWLTPISVRRAIQRAGLFFGRGLPQFEQFPSIAASLQTLCRLGFRPRFCIDVGAYHGEWTRLFKTVFPESKVLMIEAQQAKRPVLQEVAKCYCNDVSIEIALLGATDDQIVTFTEMETGSSVFAETSPYDRITREKTTCRLDTLLARGNYSDVDFLKLDVQGYELEVLKGAQTAISQAKVVLLEASFVPINAGCPLISEIIAFLNSRGFRLFDFCSQIRRRDGVLWQTDLMCIREASELLPAAELTHETWV